MVEIEANADSETLYCTVHPDRETSLRCNKCGRPMCSQCAVRTPVGYRCKECVRGQQAVFYNANQLDPLIQFVVSLPLSIIAALLAGVAGSFLGFFFIWLVMIPAASFAGGLIADLAHRAVGKRRSKYSWLAVAAGIVLGALITAGAPVLINLIAYSYYAQAAAASGAESGLPSFWAYGLGGFTSIGWWIYVVAGTAAAVARLRLGGRIRFR